MTTFRIQVSGKLEHIIKTCQSRLLTVPTAKQERINEFYNLSLISKDTVKSLGFSVNEKVSENQLEFQLKLLIEDGAGFLCCVAYASWLDPDQHRHEQEWRMMRIALVTISDPTARIPARYTGQMQLTLNTSYLQRGQRSEDRGQDVKWSSYVTTLPLWAKERKNLSETLSLPGWVNEDAFKLMKENIIKHNKLVRLADQGGQNEKLEGSNNLFQQDKEEEVHLCLFDKQQNKFVDTTLSEEKVRRQNEDKEVNKEGNNLSRTDSEPLVPSDSNRENQHNERIRDEQCVPSDTNRENLRSERNRNEQFVPSDINRENLRSERNRDAQFVPSDINRANQHIAQNKDEQFVPSNINRENQHSGRNRDQRLKDSLLDSSIPTGFLSQTEAPLLLPREPLRTPAPWHVQSRPSEADLLAEEACRLQNFRKNVEVRHVAFNTSNELQGGAVSTPAGSDQQHQQPPARGSRGLASDGSGEVGSDQPGRCRPVRNRHDHLYEEIPDLSTPKTRLSVPLPPVSDKVKKSRNFSGHKLTSI